MPEFYVTLAAEQYATVTITAPSAEDAAAVAATFAADELPWSIGEDDPVECVRVLDVSEVGPDGSLKPID